MCKVLWISLQCTFKPFHKCRFEMYFFVPRISRFSCSLGRESVPQICHLLLQLELAKTSHSEDVYKTAQCKCGLGCKWARADGAPEPSPRADGVQPEAAAEGGAAFLCTAHRRLPCSQSAGRRSVPARDVGSPGRPAPPWGRRPVGRPGDGPQDHRTDCHADQGGAEVRQRHPHLCGVQGHGVLCQV